MFSELIDRAARSARGLSDRAALDRFRQDAKKPLAQRRWAACLNAEILCRIGRAGQAQQWVNAARELSAADGSPLWLADLACCQTVLELAFDEPQRALEWAHEAWTRHLAIGRAISDQQTLDALLADIDVLFIELCDIAGADADTNPLVRRATWMNDRMLNGVLKDAQQLIRLAGSLGALELARTVAAETMAWTEQLKRFMAAVTAGRIPRPVVPLNATAEAVLESAVQQLRRSWQVEMNTDLGNAEDACGEYEHALHLFDAAARILTEAAGPPATGDRTLHLNVNSANQLAKLDRHADAQAAYEALLARCEAAGDNRALMACRFGIAGCRWRQGEGAGVLPAQMALTADLEAMYRAAPDDAWTRGMLLSAYRLLLNIIAAERAELPGHLKLLLQVLYAIRTPDAVAAAARTGDDQYADAPFAVDVLLGRWSAFDNAVLLIWETGADDFVLTTLASGSAPLADRIDIACIPMSEAGRLSDCVKATREASEQLSMRLIGLKRGSTNELERTARSVWDLLPDTLKAMLAAADTVYYAPSNASTLDEFPLEALHDGRDFLGTRKVICRVPSLRHLNEMLAPNRYRQTAPARALLVRARDPQRAETDNTVRQQAELIAAVIEGLDLTVESLEEPSADAFAAATRAPEAVLHFVGHGFAGEGGEVLVLSETEHVPIAQVAPAGGTRAPFTYFSACEVGRGRQMSSGAQRGLAATFMDAGAPAILAPAFRIPSHFLGEIAARFYQNCAGLPVGEALRQTRKILHDQQYHPACWATLALFGDPRSGLTEQVARHASPQAVAWSSLVFQHEATRDKRRLEACLQALAADTHLDAGTCSAIEAWLPDAAAAEPADFDAILEHLRAHDREAAATLDILRTLRAVRNVNTDSPQAEQEAARERLRGCLRVADALTDNYAAICVIQSISNVGVRMDAMGSLRQLLDYQHMLIERLSDDAAALANIAEPLEEFRKKLATMTFFNIGTRFGYADDDMEKADQGDPGALRRVALAMLEGEAHPEALTGVMPWHVWLLRWGGTGTATGCQNALGALKVAAKTGSVPQPAADAIRSLIGELMFSPSIDPAIAHTALNAVDRGSVEQRALMLMVLKDKIESGGGASLPDVEAGMAGAEDLSDRLGATGIAAWYRLALANHYLADGDAAHGATLLQEAIDELARLQQPRQDYTTRLAEAVELAIAVASARGDTAEAERMEREFTDVLARAGTPEQKARDDHGHRANRLGDFRPNPDGSDLKGYSRPPIPAT
jgi:CHAT domain-containing protein/tetratricopeptide (TPR) repeat protein